MKRAKIMARLRRAAAGLAAPEAREALTRLEALAERHFDALDAQTRARVADHYLPTLELVADALRRDEACGDDPAANTMLCLRVARVVTDILSAGGQLQDRLRALDLETEVIALERLAAMRGDIAGDAPGTSSGGV